MATISFNFGLRHTIFRYFYYQPNASFVSFRLCVCDVLLRLFKRAFSMLIEKMNNPSDISFIMIFLTLYHTHIHHLHVYDCDLNASRSWSHFASATTLSILRLLSQIEMSCSHRKKAFIHILINEFRSCLFLRSIFTISKRDDNKVSRNSLTENYSHSEIGSVMCARKCIAANCTYVKDTCILKTRE